MSDSVQNLIAEPEDKGTRIDKYLSQELEDVSRSRIQKLLDDGDITVDDKCVNIRCGMCIRACPTNAVSFRYGFGDGKETTTKINTEESK